jgi:hypothetical protein
MAEVTLRMEPFSLSCSEGLLPKKTYARITPIELTQNYERLNTPYDPNQAFKNRFQHIQDARAFAVAGGQTCGDVMIVNVALTLAFNTGLFPDACRA